MQQTTWMRGAAACSAALVATLTAGSVWAQGAVISAPGVDVRGGASGAAVIVNGSVVNAASGKGAVAETNIPGRSTTVRSSGSGGAAVVVESTGSQTVTVQSRSHGRKPSGGGREHVNADMANSNLANANFAGHSFTNVDMSNSNLQGANFQGAELVNVDLSNSNLSGANLSGASLVNVSLDGALTTGAIWTNGRRR